MAGLVACSRPVTPPHHTTTIASLRHTIISITAMYTVQYIYNTLNQTAFGFKSGHIVFNKANLLYIHFMFFYVRCSLSSSPRLSNAEVFFLLLYAFLCIHTLLPTSHFNHNCRFISNCVVVTLECLTKKKR